MNDFMKTVVTTAALKTQIIISQSMMEEDTISETQTLEKDDIVFILIYL